MRSSKSNTSNDQIRALLLDFDGVLADTEPIHYRFFAEVLAEEGIRFSRDDYDKKYLGLDDRSCFRTIHRDCGRTLAAADEERLVREKNRRLLDFIRGQSLLLPGVSNFLRKLGGRYYLSIVSGALRSEIEAILNYDGLRSLFHLILGAEEVSRGKPDPEGFLMAIKLLNRDHVPESEILLPVECLAVEDSPWGIAAATGAGINCIALTTSYPASGLSGAWKILERLDQLGDLLKIA